MGSKIDIYKDNCVISIDSRTIHEKRMIPVVQYTINGIEIAKFNSIAEAQRITKIKHISECINNKRFSSGGYIWKIEKEFKYEYN